MAPTTNTELDFNQFFNVIEGKLTSTATTRHGIDPATEINNPAVPVSTRDDVELAVASAKTAFEKWSSTSVVERRAAICAFADAIEANASGFAQMLTKEQGKPITLAKQEVGSAVYWMRSISNLELSDECIKDDENVSAIVRHVPLGVVVGIVPWNFPIWLACAKIAPALISGNTIIIKPSPFTPYCVLKMAELAQRFFPPGVVQALSGDDLLGEWLTTHPNPAKIHFTGSTVTGRKVMESASKTLKRVTLECGGNDAAIVCPDVDIAKTAQKIATLGFLNSGQICFIFKRVYVHESIYDEFRDQLVEATKHLKVGPGVDETTRIGPVQNRMQYEKLKDLLQHTKDHGGHFAIGGQTLSSGTGYFINPTIVDCPSDQSRIVVEEQFGPIIPLLRWATEEEVIKRANETIYGLAASVWAVDLTLANRLARRLEGGIVWINTHFDPDPGVPVGGHKQSGIGVEFGVAGLKTYCNSQAIFLRKQ